MAAMGGVHGIDPWLETLAGKLAEEPVPASIDEAIATLAQDYAFGRDGVAAFKEALAGTGATLAFEEYAPTDTQDFTASAQRIFEAMKDIEGRKFLFIIWAGGNNPIGKIKAMEPERLGIEIATGGNILAAMKAYKALPGMEGATYRPSSTMAGGRAVYYDLFEEAVS